MNELLQKLRVNASDFFRENEKVDFSLLLKKLRISKIEQEKSNNLQKCLEKPFVMPIEDVFDIHGKGIIATGIVDSGKINIYEMLDVWGAHSFKSVLCAGFEFRLKLWDSAQIGMNVGVILRNIERSDIRVGQTLVISDTIKPSSEFEAECYLFAKKECGKEHVLVAGSRPKFAIGTNVILGRVLFDDYVKEMRSGEVKNIHVSLLYPQIVQENTLFLIMQGEEVLGIGLVK